jgi:hypothetical protein
MLKSFFTLLSSLQNEKNHKVLKIDVNLSSIKSNLSITIYRSMYKLIIRNEQDCLYKRENIYYIRITALENTEMTMRSQN